MLLSGSMPAEARLPWKPTKSYLGAVWTHWELGAKILVQKYRGLGEARLKLGLLIDFLVEAAEPITKMISQRGHSRQSRTILPLWRPSELRHPH
jgi:hypothetical protein